MQQQGITPRNGNNQLSSTEILQKLMKKHSKHINNNQSISNRDNQNTKSISKSPGNGWQSHRNQNSETKINKIRHQSNEDLQQTLKKPHHISHVSQLFNSKEWMDSQSLHHKSQNPKEFIQNANAFLREKTLENKIDKLFQQVIDLKKKSDKLEYQNKILFNNLQKVQTEKQNNEERNLLLDRLDQMISMQKKQEENLEYFKQMFPQNDEQRRIKTQQSQPKQRNFGKSAYIGFNL